MWRMIAVLPALVGETSGQAFEPIERENDAFRLPDMGASGVLGDPSAADAAAGERFLAEAVTALAHVLDALPQPTAKEAHT